MLSAVNGSTWLTESSLAMMAVLVSTVPPRIAPVTRTVITRSLTVAVPMFSIGSSSPRRLDPLQPRARGAQATKPYFPRACLRRARAL